MRRDDQLDDIRDGATAAVRFLDGRTREELFTDELLAAALTQKVIVIGEAAGAVSSAMKDRLAGVPWQRVVGMRNVVVHPYWHVDRGELWRTVKEDLPEVLEALRSAEAD